MCNIGYPKHDTTPPTGLRGRLLCAVGAVLAALALAPSATAQEADAASAQEPSTSQGTCRLGDEFFCEEVVVTARRRDALLTDVPLSVSAFTAAQMEDRALLDLHDIAQETPGLVYENYATAGLSSAAVIRGMGQTFTLSRVQNTAVFLDGIYLQRQSMVNPSLLNMERVEIIKGPQNAQFGRNAFSGAVQYVTKRPPEERVADFTLGFGSGDRFDRRIELGAPLIDGVLSARVFAALSDFDGHTDNDHPLADDGPNDATEDMLGGWEDGVYSLGVTWTPTPSLGIDAAFHHSESEREPQAFYDLNGARYAYETAEFGGPPFFPFLAPTGANCLNTTTFSDRQPFPARGNHAWCGELPTAPPVLNDPALSAAGFADTRGKIVVDPRSVALDTRTRIMRLNLDYELNESLTLDYQFGRVEHRADNRGVVEGRASLVGSAVAHLPVQTSPAPPFITALGPPGSFGAVARTSVFYANPMEELEATSHELRLNFNGEKVLARGGVYFSDTEDEDGGTYRFVAPCDSAGCGVAVADADGVLAGTYIAVVPVVPGRLNVGVPHFFDTGHGALADHVAYRDEVRALFGDVEWPMSDTFTVAVEARYTRESKSFEQFSTTFGAPMPPNVAAEDKETFTFFTPRIIAKWTPNSTNMVYALAAKGVKTGGFNAVDPTQNADQGTYDEERNITLELGTKNTLLDGRLTLNAALYAIDWEGVQGVEAASSPDAWLRDVVGNIGDADVVGVEVEGVWRPSESFFVDYGLAYSDATYNSGTYQSSMAGPTSSWGCDNTVCRADGSVDGKRIERTSKSQYNVGLNYIRGLGGATAVVRFDFNYRGNMFATPMNLAHNGSRTLANMSVKVAGERWQVALWGRNIFDKEYVANSFVLPSFNRYIVGLGPRRTFGLTVKGSL